MADVSVLKQAGMNIDELPDEQREALSKLDQSELETLAAIRTKLNTDEGDDVSGYMMATRPIAGDGSLIW